MPDELTEVARRWLSDEGLLRRAWKPPASVKECGYGFAVGEWEQSVKQYASDVAYNDRLIASLVEVLKGTRST